MAEFTFSNQTEIKMYNHRGQTYCGDEKSPDYRFEGGLPQFILFTVKGFDLSFLGHPLCGHFYPCFDLFFLKPHLCVYLILDVI
jgi:hypothetical protein